MRAGGRIPRWGCISHGPALRTQKGRGLAAPPPEARPSACAEKTPSRAGWRVLGWSLHWENWSFSGETVAGATLNCDSGGRYIVLGRRAVSSRAARQGQGEVGSKFASGRPELPRFCGLEPITGHVQAGANADLPGCCRISPRRNFALLGANGCVLRESTAARRRNQHGSEAKRSI